MYSFSFAPDTALNIRRALREHIEDLKGQVVDAVERGNLGAAQMLAERMRDEQKALDAFRAQLTERSDGRLNG